MTCCLFYGNCSSYNKQANNGMKELLNYDELTISKLFSKIEDG